MADQKIPRYIVTLTDTKTEVRISAGSNDLADFTQPYAEETAREQGVKNELELMFKTFRSDVCEAELAKSLTRRVNARKRNAS